MGCAGKSCRNSPAGAVCWKDMLWEPGSERFLGFHKGGWHCEREHKEMFSFSCGKVKASEKREW